MRVSLVQAPYWSLFTPPYALALLTGNLRSKGITTFQHSFDVPFYRSVSDEEKMLWLDEKAAFWSTWNSDQTRHLVQQMISDHSSVVDRMVDEVLADEPDVVGFSVKIWSHWFSLALAERLKRRAPNVYVIFGGPQASDGCFSLEKHTQIDALCRREADLSFPRFLRSLERNGMKPCGEPGFVFRDESGKAVDCGHIKEFPRALDVPMADYSDYDFEQYLHPHEITLMLSRGCINRCSYCSESPSFGRFRSFPAEKIFAEIVYHWERTNCRRPMKVLLNDSLINGNMRELERLAELLIEHRNTLQVSYSGMMFIREELTDEVVDKLVGAGLTDVLFGIESGSPEVLKRMHKRYKLETAEAVLRRFHQRGVEVVASAIFGHPGETEAEFHKSLNFFRANAPNVSRVLVNYLGLYGNCDITSRPEHYNIDPATVSPNGWVGDGGKNTFEVRAMRTELARLALGQKVPDIGGFISDGRALYDPVKPYRDEIKALKAELADHDALRKRTLPPMNRVPYGPGREFGWFEWVIPIKPGVWQAKGWARDPVEDKTAREVVIYNQRGRLVAYCRPDWERLDVAVPRNNERLNVCGFRVLFSNEDLDPGRNELFACVLCPKGEDAFELPRAECFAVERVEEPLPEPSAAAPRKPAPALPGFEAEPVQAADESRPSPEVEDGVLLRS